MSLESVKPVDTCHTLNRPYPCFPEILNASNSGATQPPRLHLWLRPNSRLFWKEKAKILKPEQEPESSAGALSTYRLLGLPSEFLVWRSGATGDSAFLTSSKEFPATTAAGVQGHSSRVPGHRLGLRGAGIAAEPTLKLRTRKSLKWEKVVSKVFICASISSLIIVRCSSVRPLAPGGCVPVRSRFFLLIKARLCSTAASDMITAGTARRRLRYLRGARPPFLIPWAAAGEGPSARNPLLSGLRKKTMGSSGEAPR